MPEKELCKSLYQKTGGYMKGICHPGEDCSPLREAGIEWVRLDVPYPYTEDGDVSESLIRFRERCVRYAEEGISTVLVTPYPRTFRKYGIDIQTGEGLETVSAVCRFLAESFRELRVCWQATNEMHIEHFRAPLTIPEAVRFLSASIRGLKAGNPDAAIGHNSVDEGWEQNLAEIEKNTGGCDYIGFDLYDGTWSKGGPESYIATISRIYDVVRLPVVLMEFGFASLGGYMDESGEDVKAYLNGLGFRDLEEVRERTDDFIAALSPSAAEYAMRCAPADRYNCVERMMPHILKKWPVKNRIPHTEAGQAQFYARLLPLLLENPYLAGSMIYCWRDSKRCFLCGASDCPCETAWGLVRIDGTPKPAYDVVKELWA
ncbi:MAG: hypothetical protein NC432_13860 [Roseburia sp.]|nr:hypothetical protein [Roseburia sp.]MCM1098163.1 hypothetical protein [Ruminococcus flavefaciens]